METVLPLARLEEMGAYMDPRVLRHIHEGQSEAFEGFEGFDLIAFDWYDVHSDRTEDARFLLYLDRERLLCFCQEERGLARARAIENQTFLALCNSAAADTACAGHSAIIDPWGEYLAQAGETEEIISAQLDFSVIQGIRESINVFRDRRPDLYCME